MTVSDPGNVCYELWGLQTLPSDIVLSSDGRVLEFHAGAMNIGEAEGMLIRAKEGRDAAGFAFIEGMMSNGNGGFYTTLTPKKFKQNLRKQILTYPKQAFQSNGQIGRAHV